jgi:hypothetical protein
MIRRLAQTQFEGWVLSEVGRSRDRVRDLRSQYPSASQRELANRLIEAKKKWAATGGAVSGLFGLISLPADLALVAYLQISLIVDLAVLCNRNVKSTRARSEILEIFAAANTTVGIASRASPKATARVAERILAARGFRLLGRTFPLVAAPLTVVMNNRDLEKAAEEALRYYSVIPLALGGRRPVPGT